MELFKILKNKKLISAIILLLIFNCIAFYLTTQKTFLKDDFDISVFQSVVEDCKDDLKVGNEAQIKSKCEDYITLLDFINSDEPNDVPKFNDESIYLSYLNNEYSKPELYALVKIYSFYDYQNEYQKVYKTNIDLSLDLAENLMESNLFTDKTSFVYKSVEKQANDIKDNSNIELSFVNDMMITSLLNYHISDLILLFIGILLILGFNSNHKFNAFINTCKNGRTKLRVKQISILILFLFVGSFCIYFSEYLISQNIYVLPLDWNAAIQSSTIFKDCVYNLNYLELAFIFIIYKSLICLMVSLSFWILLTFINNLSIVSGVLGIFLAIQYVLFTRVSSQSNLQFFKTFNLFSLLDFSNITKYNLIPFFNIPIRTDLTIILVTVILISVFVILILVSSKYVYPIKSPNKLFNRLNKVSNKISLYISKIQNMIYSNRYESYKIMHIGKGVIFMVVLFVILGYSLNSNYIQQSPVEIMLNDYYESYSGELNDNVYSSIQKLEEEINIADNEYNQAQLLKQDGNISFEQYNAAIIKHSTYESKRQVLSVLTDQVNRLKELENKGIKPVLINESGYNSLFDAKTNQMQIILATIFSILIFSTVFSIEKTSGMFSLNHASKYGRSKLFFKKILSIIPKSFIISLACYSTSIIKINSIHKLTYLSAGINNLDALKNIDLDLTIIEYLILNFIFEFLFITIVSLLIASLSLFMSQMANVILTSSLFVIPSLLYLANFHSLKNVALVHQFNLNVLLRDETFGIETFSFHIVLILITFIAVILCGVNWSLNKKR